MHTPDTQAATVSRLRIHPLLVIGATVLLAVALLLTVPYQSNWWKVIILGIVEGLTEFLPISSTGHLLIASDLLAYEGSLDGTFEIFIQLGAVLAVVGFYARDLLAQVRAVPHDRAARRFWLAIVIAFIPAALFGLLFYSTIKTVLFSPLVIGISLIVGGIVLILVERMPLRPATALDVTQITLRQALGIGLAQVLALIPGVSRSGSSIMGSLLVGLDRKTATAFSFYLAIPTLGMATIVELLLSLERLTSDDLSSLLLGAVVSFIVAWLSIGWLLRYVASNSFVNFGIYRIFAGIVILVLIAAGQL
ncbi:MAG TPA: undecaprenyl-diphosphate phosphatase [Roseiflexaceae bacterium]|nr:undecaprenyl-diphosphate phosphatase [Roseiflexaceae bacterium]